MRLGGKFRFAISVALVYLVGHLPSTSWVELAEGAGDEPKKVETTSPGLRMHRLQAGEPGKDGWYEGKSTEGHFRVSLPFPFNDATIQIPADPTARGYLIGSASPDGYKFSAVEIEAKKGSTRLPLKSILERIREKGEMKVSDERFFQFQGYPAVEYRAVTRKTGVYTRTIDCTDRLISLIVEYPVGLEAKVKPLVSVFFDSLRIELKLDEKGK